MDALGRDDRRLDALADGAEDGHTASRRSQTPVGSDAEAPGWSIAQCGLCSWQDNDGSPLERLGRLLDHVRDVHQYGRTL